MSNIRRYVISYHKDSVAFLDMTESVLQVSDVKLSFEGTNWLSRLALRFGFWLSNKFLSSRCAAKDIRPFKPFLYEAWEDMYKKFQNLNKANPFTCFMFACRMAHSFDKASSGKMNLAANDASPTEGGNIPKFKQNQTNEVSQTGDSSSRTERKHSEVYDFLAKNNALPPEAVPYVQFYPTEGEGKLHAMYIYRDGKVEIELDDLDDESTGVCMKAVPVRNVTILDDDSSNSKSRKNRSKELTINGEYCDEFDNSTWKQFSYQAKKKDVYCWKNVNDLLAKLTDENATVDLSKLVKNIPGISTDNENVLNATEQGGINGEEIKLKIDYDYDKVVSLSKIDGKKKIPLNNPVISLKPDSKQVIITAQDDGQQHSFVVELSDLIVESKWQSLGDFASKNVGLDFGEWIGLSSFFKKKGIYLKNKAKMFIVKDVNSEEKYEAKLVEPNSCIYNYWQIETKGVDDSLQTTEIRKIPNDDEYVLLSTKTRTERRPLFRVKLVDLLDKDGWEKQNVVWFSQTKKE